MSKKQYRTSNKPQGITLADDQYTDSRRYGGLIKEQAQYDPHEQGCFVTAEAHNVRVSKRWRGTNVQYQQNVRAPKTLTTRVDIEEVNARRAMKRDPDYNKPYNPPIVGGRLVW